jgi:hypothetical protein
VFFLTWFRHVVRRFDRHTVAMCRPPFPYDRLVGPTD